MAFEEKKNSITKKDDQEILRVLSVREDVSVSIG
jgi:hypothetical protein